MKWKDIKIGDYVFIEKYGYVKDKKNHQKVFQMGNIIYIGFVINKRVIHDDNDRRRLVIRSGLFSNIRWRYCNDLSIITFSHIKNIYILNSIYNQPTVIHKNYPFKIHKYLKNLNSMDGWNHPYAKQIKEKQERIKNSSPEKKIDLLIERLAELNLCGSLFPLGEELNTERQLIIEGLIEGGYIILENHISKGGFSFIGDKKDKHKEIYLNTYNNF